MSTRVSRGIDTTVPLFRSGATWATITTSLSEFAPLASTPAGVASDRLSVPTSRKVSAPVDGGRDDSSSSPNASVHPRDVVAEPLRHHEGDTDAGTEQDHQRQTPDGDAGAEAAAGAGAVGGWIWRRGGSGGSGEWEVAPSAVRGCTAPRVTQHPCALGPIVVSSRSYGSPRPGSLIGE